MSILIGNKTAKRVYRGTQKVRSVCIGNKTVCEEESQPEPDPDRDLDFFIEALTPNATVSMQAVNSAPAVKLIYRTSESSSWSNFTPGTTVVTLENVGDRVYFMSGSILRGTITLIDNVKLSNGQANNYWNFVLASPHQYKVGGCLRTLLYNRNNATYRSGTLADNAFACLFDSCTGIVDASKLSFGDVKTIGANSYANLFYGCTGLVTGPKNFSDSLIVDDVTLGNYSFFATFYGCTSLTQAPELPFTNLNTGCYYSMFQNCTSLTNAPELPATTLAVNCYDQMFSGCYNIDSPIIFDMTACTSVPTLPSSTLFSKCQQEYYVIVPDYLYDEWIEATNWSAIVDYLVPESLREDIY